MGNNTTTAKDKKEPKMYMSVWKDMARLMVYPVVADLLDNIEDLKKDLESISGDQISQFGLEVERHNLFQIAIRHYKSKFARSKQVHEIPIIMFKDEEAFDGDGLRREFYSLFFQDCLFKEELFVGQGRRRVPSNNVRLVKEKQLSALGVAVVEAIVNCDCGFPYLNEALYHFMIGDKNYEKYLKMEDIPDPSILNLAEQVMKAKTDEEVNTIIISPDGGCMEGTGWPPEQTIRMSNREQFVKHLTKWSVIEQRRAAIDQFKDGLNYKGFISTLKSNELLKCLLVFSGQYCVTSKYLRECLSIGMNELEDSDEQKKRSKKFFNDLLNEMTDEQASYFHFFMTGVLDPPISVTVFEIKFNTNPHSILPEAITCANTIILPLGHNQYSDFKKCLLTAFEHAREGFGNT